MEFRQRVRELGFAGTKGEVSAVITSAAPLPDAELKKITAQLDSFLVRARCWKGCWCC